MNYLQELESKFHKNFIDMESNVEYKLYNPIRYMEMLEEILYYFGYKIKGNRKLEAFDEKRLVALDAKHQGALDEKQQIPTTRGTLKRRYDFKTEPPSVWIEDKHGRWFKWTIYEELDHGYHIRYLDTITTISKNSLYRDAMNGVEVIKSKIKIEIPISSMRFNLSCLRDTDNVNYELEKRIEMVLRGDVVPLEA